MEDFVYQFCDFSIGSNDYVNNYLQPFLADGQQYTHDEFVGLLISKLGEQFTVKNPLSLQPSYLCKFHTSQI